MYADDFEEQLSRQPLRRVPAEWRQEILQAAVASRNAPQQELETPPVVAWWRVWLWPCPQAWAALVAAWALVFFFNTNSPTEQTPVVANRVRPSREMMEILQQQQREIAKLLLPPATAVAPPPAVNRPRSERRLRLIAA